MNGGYTILGSPTADDLVNKVNQYMAGGWLPQGGPFQAMTRKGSAIAMHTDKPRLLWFQAVLLPPAAAEQYMLAKAQDDAAEGVEGADGAGGTGKQAMGPDEYEEEQASGAGEG